jgi:hypothetical protein
MSKETGMTELNGTVDPESQDELLKEAQDPHGKRPES